MGSQTNLTCATKKFARPRWTTWSHRMIVTMLTCSNFHVQVCVCGRLQPQQRASWRIWTVLDQLLIPSGVQNMPQRSPGALRISPEDLLKSSEDLSGASCDRETIPTLKALRCIIIIPPKSHPTLTTWHIWPQPRKSAFVLPRAHRILPLQPPARRGLWGRRIPKACGPLPPTP